PKLPPQPNPEQVRGTIIERQPESEAAQMNRAAETFNQKPSSVVAGPAVAVQAAVPKDPLQVTIENVLEEGLGEAYLKLPPDKKEEFKIVGEQTAQKITVLLRAATIKIGEIFALIVKWLRIIPGVNKFFLQQEAKIKTDQLLKLNK
ncbi:MAG: hypothetical protein NTV81_00110, partial [Candidatus Komeilibacteria bacterium]|nr:hypothetical protein [Candidatus Komeilibacteria bacterium]